MQSLDLNQAAITSAMSGDWKAAIKINSTLLKSDPENIEALNRLARAYLETGQKSAAQKSYEKVLRLDKFNSIAAKNLALLKKLRIDPHRRHSPLPATVSPIFLEEPGVTKTVSLIRLGDPKVISRLHPGDPVTVVSRAHNVAVISSSLHYLGRLPDDLASRLRPFIKSGNTYAAWIRSIDMNGPDTLMRVFIKELSRSPKFRLIPSFPLTEKLAYAAFTPPELVHEEKPDVSATEFQEESETGRVEVDAQDSS